MALWKKKRGGWRRIGVKFAEQENKTVLLSATISSIYDQDASLTPLEQQDAIQALPGMTAKEMQSIILATGPGLAPTIRNVISAHRARNDRSQKDKVH